MMTTYTNLYFKYPQTLHHLTELGFIPLSSRKDETYFKYRFPVCFWDRKDGSHMPTLFCILTADLSTNHVLVDVKTLQDMFYADFYTQEYGNPQPLLGRIQKRIDKELLKLKIIEKKPKKVKESRHDRTRSKDNRKSDRKSSGSSKEVLQGQKSTRNTRSRTKVSGKDI